MYENIYNILSFYFIFFDDSFFLLNFGSWYFFTVQDMNEVCGDIGFPVLKEHPLPLLTPSSPTHPASLPNSTHWNRMNLKKPTSPQNLRVFSRSCHCAWDFFFFFCLRICCNENSCVFLYWPPLLICLVSASGSKTAAVKYSCWVSDISS